MLQSTSCYAAAAFTACYLPAMAISAILVSLNKEKQRL